MARHFVRTEAMPWNSEDHLFLESACRRFGIWYSRPGNGISHVVHMQRFGKPGKTLLGSDNHTPAAGSLGMLAIGAGGLDVALAMSGEPFPTTMPGILGVKLVGELPDWVSAKDVILEMLRRHGVSGGVGKIVEYYGPGLRCLSAMDRHVIANMGAELGATTTVFPSAIKKFPTSRFFSRLLVLCIKTDDRCDLLHRSAAVSLQLSHQPVNSPLCSVEIGQSRWCRLAQPADPRH
jgi:aconitase A